MDMDYGRPPPTWPTGLGQGSEPKGMPVTGLARAIRERKGNRMGRLIRNENRAVRERLADLGAGWTSPESYLPWPETAADPPGLDLPRPLTLEALFGRSENGRWADATVL